MVFLWVEHIPPPDQIQVPRSLARAKPKFTLLPSFHLPDENDFMGEQRNPFLGLAKITVTSAHQFMFPVRPFNQPRFAETVDNFARVYDAIQFHAPERNSGGWTLAVPVNNYFQLVCLGNAAGKIKWAVRHETGQPHPAR
jgi:hypothetical protein